MRCVYEILFKHLSFGVLIQDGELAKRIDFLMEQHTIIYMLMTATMFLATQPQRDRTFSDVLMTPGDPKLASYNRGTCPGWFDKYVVKL